MNPQVEHAARLHEELQAFLAREHPTAPLAVVLSALTYEIGRLVGQTMTDDETRRMLDRIADTLIEQIKAHRGGRLRG
jgi:flagellar motor switch protein FliG